MSDSIIRGVGLIKRYRLRFWLGLLLLSILSSCSTTSKNLTQSGEQKPEKQNKSKHTRVNPRVMCYSF